jgi:hypothetical protein
MEGLEAVTEVLNEVASVRGVHHERHNSSAVRTPLKKKECGHGKESRLVTGPR